MKPCPSPSRSTLITAAVAFVLAAGWGAREAQFARAQAKRVPNITLNASDVKMADAQYEGKTTGKAGVYLDGSSPAHRSFQVGRFLLDPGAQPHPPHRHVDEEVMIITRGQGEIVCDGKTYAVGPGAVMYCDPNVEHGIKNTGTRPIEFYWVKYTPENGK